MHDTCIVIVDDLIAIVAENVTSMCSGATHQALLFVGAGSLADPRRAIGLHLLPKGTRASGKSSAVRIAWLRAACKANSSVKGVSSNP